MSLKAIVKEPANQADAVVIWLHGLGDSGAGFSDVIPALGLAKQHNIRFIFPHAPKQAVTINRGLVMRSWYDIKTMELSDRADIVTLQQSETLVKQLIEQQIAGGIEPGRIVLVGFSQGGVLSLYSGLRLKHKLAGIVGLSCYLAQTDLAELGAAGINARTPLFMSHGEHDATVPFAAGKQAAQQLTAAGFELIWSQYPMEHWVCEPQLKKLGQWLTKQLARENNF